MEDAPCPLPPPLSAPVSCAADDVKGVPELTPEVVLEVGGEGDEEALGLVAGFGDGDGEAPELGLGDGEGVGFADATGLAVGFGLALDPQDFQW